MEPDINYNSPEWGLVTRWLEGELEDTLGRLCKLDATVEELRANQGRAALLKQMLSFGEQAAYNMGR